MLKKRSTDVDEQGANEVIFPAHAVRTIQAGMVKNRNTVPEKVMTLLFIKLTLLLGIFSAGHSLYRFFYFMQSDRIAGKAVMWMLGGEFVGLSIYCVFTTCELLERMPAPPASTALRGIAFSSALAASIHMSHAIRKIGDDLE